MSTPAASAPTPVRTASSSSRRDATPSRDDSGAKTPTNTQRNGTESASAPRPQSVHQNSGGRPPSSARHAQLATVARRDAEHSDMPNSAQSPTRRSNSVDRYQVERQRSRDGTTQRASRTHSRQSSEAPAEKTETAPPEANPNRTSVAAAAPARRRTTVTAQTGTWALGKTVGAGSMGKVKIARNVETGEQAAIKIVPRYSQEDHRSQQDRERADHSKEVRTQREAAIVTLVSHPYICGMRDVIRTNYHWYMLFEYVNGGQMLDYIISHGRLKEKQARKFARQIASALDYCHRNSIVHRDLKIENILISKTGDIKIIDFGLSNLFSPRSQLKTFCGSLYFAAPELLQAKVYLGPEVDIWSFGIVLYVLVCGKVPFDDQSMPQLHAKIKKGAVEYPPWLSAECRHIISRMLVVDPKNRASLAEIMNHPWMTKGFNGPPENFLPHREPLQLPLDQQVIDKMNGFDFGPSEYIRRQLEATIESEDYQRAVRSAARKTQSANSTDSHNKRASVFDFYNRRKSGIIKDGLNNPSTEAVQFGEDPVNAFSPLISIYYLVREKMERESQEANPGILTMPQSPGEKPLKMPDLPAPEAAHTNTSAYEMAGEAPTGGRARPRARTHGEDDAPKQPTSSPTAAAEKVPPVINEPNPSSPAPPTPTTRKEGVAGGILRRLSTRRSRDVADLEKSKSPPPLTMTAAVPETPPSATTPGRRSFTMRKSRDPPSAYGSIVEKHPDLLAPPSSSDSNKKSSFKGLGRSASVNSPDLRRRLSRRSPNEKADTEAAERNNTDSKSKAGMDTASDSEARPRPTAARTRSLNHVRRSSVQTRRMGRERAEPREEDVPEETDQELAQEPSHNTANESQEALKPIYLKGLFSVSTTSTKPLSVIRTDLIRVLKQVGVEYKEMKSGFSCRHIPSIDINKVQDPQSPESKTLPHRRRISFAAGRSSDKDRAREDVEEHERLHPVAAQKSAYRRGGGDSSYTTQSEEESEDENAAQRPSAKSPRVAGETTTQVQSDTGRSMILKFDIMVVKVPILAMHGLQFKKVDGGTWQYKRMAETILNELNL